MPEMAADASANAPDHDEMPAMSFLDHLEELRKRIIYSLIAVAVGFLACWRYAERIFGSCSAPSWMPSIAMGCQRNSST